MSEGKGTASSSGGNLDITEVSNDDTDELAQSIEKFYKTDSTTKTRLSYHWDRNHKFLDGEQWLVFDGDRETGGVWKRLTVSKPNEYIPRPVTNYIFDAYQTLKSYLIKDKPRSTVRPNTQAFRDKGAAQVAELCLEANWERLQEQANYEYAASCLVTYGTVFKKSYWDTSSLVMVSLPKMVDQPITDPMTGAVVGSTQVEAVDPESGQPIMEEVPLGDLNTDVVEPYRIALDPAANDIHKIKWIMEYAIQPLDWIKENYDKPPEEGSGFTGKFSEVKEEKELSTTMRRFYNLKTSSGVKGTAGLGEGSVSSSGDTNITNCAVVKEYYERPSSKHPKGRLVVVANGICLYAGESPYEGPELGAWHPYSECRWEILPGRFWGKSPLDAACEIQKHINSIDSVIILTRKTSAIPQKLVPLNSGIANGSWTGRPGQEIHYRAADGGKPELLPSQGVDPTVFQERAQRADDLKNITGAIDILKGERPSGVTASSALNLLYEVGTGKLYPMLERWKRFVENDQKKQLRTMSKFYQEPRKDYISLLVSKNKDLSVEAIQHFIGSDLYDNCNVVVEAGSNVPKLHAAKQAALEEAARAGTLNLNSAQNRMEYNRQMGIVGFDNDVGPDTHRAEYENDLLDNIEHNPNKRPIILEVDEDAIHIEVLARRMKEPSFMDLSGVVQQAYMEHYGQHLQQQNMKLQRMQMEAVATGVPPEQQQPPGASQGTPEGQPNQPQAPASASPSRGGGATTAQKNALGTDMFVPGGRKTR